MIEIKGLSIRFGPQEVLKGLDWLITPKSRIGLVGDNGAGKTTLLRVIAGEHEPDGGTVSIPRGHVIGYLPQDLVEIDDIPLFDFLKRRAGIETISRKLAETEAAMSGFDEKSQDLRGFLAEHERLQSLFEAKGGFDFDNKATQVLKGLGFHPERDRWRMISEFSGGWKMKISLAALLLLRPDTLLLDEPTNYLDTESMEWLENWLRDYQGTMIASSHDRRFLEKMVTSVAELASGKINIYSCGYVKYLAERKERRERLEKERARQKGEIDDMRRFIERFRYKATKAAQVQSRVRQLEKVKVTELDAPPKSVSFKFPEATRSGLDVLTVRGLSKSYGSNHVFSGVDFTIQRGEKVALVGVNGAGKSTLLRLLNRVEQPTSGEVIEGLNVKRRYYSQESAENLDYNKTIWQEINNTGTTMLEGEKRNLLGAFLFSGDEIYKSVSVLSGGEKTRVGLLKILLLESNLLILDEPTNHLDYATKELFQKALLKYRGTVLIVSHDRAFLDDLVERVLEIRGGRLYDYKGNYSWFIDKRAMDAEKISAEAVKKQEASPDKNKEQKRAEADARNRIYREKKFFRDRIKPVEEAIAKDEIKKDEISALLCNPSILSDSTVVQSLMIKLKNIEARLETEYAEWEELASKIEEIK